MISTAESWHHLDSDGEAGGRRRGGEGGGGERREGPALAPKPSLHVDHRAPWACHTCLFSK